MAIGEHTLNCLCATFQYPTCKNDKNKDNVLKYKAHLKVKFKCASVTMYSLVMSPFSHDFAKRK